MKLSPFFFGVSLLLASLVALAELKSNVLEGRFKRIDSDHWVSFDNGEYKEQVLIEQSVAYAQRLFEYSGVYEKAVCFPAYDTKRQSIPGSHMFYESSGSTCCARVRTVGSKLLIDVIALKGSAVEICQGGVFEKP
jgi:hypothetical protein